MRIRMLVCILLMSCLLCACSAGASGAPAPDEPPAGVLKNSVRFNASDFLDDNRARVEAAGGFLKYVDGVQNELGIVQPVFFGDEAAQTINEQIDLWLTERVSYYAQEGQLDDPGEVYLYYDVTDQTDKYISMIFQIYGANMPEVVMEPMTFDARTGERCGISAFFTEEDNAWRGIIPDIVTEQAQIQNIVLLNEVPPVRDDQMFFIDQGDIVVMYHPYEIATYEAGYPCFVLPFGRIESYLNTDYGIGEDG